MAGFLLFPVAAAIGLLVSYVGGEQRGWIAGIFVGALIALIRVSWPLRARSWFWAVVAAFAAADLLAVTLVDWSFTTDWNGHTISGLAALDFGVMMAIVYGIYRLKYGTPAQEFAESPDDAPNYSQRDLDL